MFGNFSESDLNKSQKELNPEKSLNEKINMSLDEIIKEKKDNFSKISKFPKNYNKYDNKPIIIKLDLNERQIDKITNQCCLDTDGCEVYLQLIVQKK